MQFCSSLVKANVFFHLLHFFLCQLGLYFEPDDRTWWYKLFCTGGLDPDDPWNKKDNKEHVLMVFFRDYFASFLNNVYAKGILGEMVKMVFTDL